MTHMSTPQIGYAAMLEQFHPTEVIDLAEYAEQHGFDGVMTSDHYQPWTPQQGQSAFVWNVLSALGQRTKGDIGPGVTALAFRWHPAMVAQASATLAAMYPGRHWLGLGSGEALNEHIFGATWPKAPERIDRMFEAIEIIQKLFTGKDFEHSGKFYQLETTRLWTMPDVAPPIYVATAGLWTAKRAGRVADGLITVGAPHQKLTEIIHQFDEGVLQSGRDPQKMTKILQLHLSWAPTDAEAMHNALTEWPNGGMKFPKADIHSPYEFERLAKLVRPEDFAGRMVISADTDVHRAHIQSFLDLGFDRIYLHNVGRNQRQWIEAFGRNVLPKLTYAR